MKKIPLFAILLFVAHTTTVFAGFSKVGTASAQFLKIGIGARPAAMGEAYAALANDASALYWNPAGLTQLRQRSLAVSHTEWFAGIAHDFIGIVLPYGSSAAFGLSVITLNTGEQEVTTVRQPEGTGINYDVSDIAIGLTYARSLTDRFSAAITVKYVRQNAYNESASAVAFDLGTMLDTGYRGLKVGMCMSNFGGSMQLDGRDLIASTDLDREITGNYNTDARLKTEPWPLPLNFRVGLAMDLVGDSRTFLPMDSHRLTLAIDGNHPNDNEERVNFGVEYAWREIFFARAGYKSNYDVEDWTYGFGLKLDVGSTNLNFDYALVDFKDLGKVSRFSLGFDF